MSTAPIPPGKYIRLRREARGLSVDDVALALETIPHVSARTRAEWLLDIEEGAAPVQIDAAIALQGVLGFDWTVLVHLCAAAAALPCSVPPICSVCACSQHDPCEEPDGRTCGWAQDDLCTTCAPMVAGVVAIQRALVG